MATAPPEGYRTPENIVQCETHLNLIEDDSQNHHSQQERRQLAENVVLSNNNGSANSPLKTENMEKSFQPPGDESHKTSMPEELQEKTVPKVRNGKSYGGNNRNCNNNNNNGNSQKLNFRAPQQYLQKKNWKKQFNARHKRQPVNKADMENIQNIKNQINLHRKQQNTQKSIKQVYNKKSQRSAQFSIRSKFFLPDKRPRKEIIIPPTKFLLGGNISDPLNLNSLQNEALNATPTVTPKQSPITTPPKVEVIIPPNINDPLHLLDPVDSVEYEKQLVSPMKRKSKSKHRHRKKKSRRKRNENSISSEVGTAATVNAAPKFNNVNTMASALAGELAATSGIVTKSTESSAEAEVGISSVDTVLNKEENVDAPSNNATINSVVSAAAAQKGSQKDSAQKSHTAGPNTTAGRRNGDREKAAKDLRLDLRAATEYQQQVNSGGGRKRKISEGPNSSKNKFRRLDSMDKIVSPVVPQPGAWKRPPRTVPTGARKISRVRSTSVSETELISPTDEFKTIESESVRGDTPDVEAQKQDEANIENRPPVFPRKKFKPEGAKYQYGNYNRYQGCRYLNEFMDVRLQVFKRHPDLFRAKDILDIGCNVGHITIAVAKDLAPKSILGVDIDSNLIRKARRNISMYVRIPKEDDAEEKKCASDAKKPESVNANDTKEDSTNKDNKVVKNPGASHSNAQTSQEEKSKKIFNVRRKAHHRYKLEVDRTEFFPISFPICYGGIPSSSPTNSADESCSPSASAVTHRNNLKNEFPKNVYFRTANYVLSDESLLNNDTQQYDLILCLSVTKWIHLNFGDAGLKLAFKRMFNQLRPGGKLILEAQNWASYKKKKNLTERIYNNYCNIEFFPNKFHEYLLSNEVGFSHSYTLGVPRHLNKGFCRPIQLYAKGDFTPSHIRWSDTYYPQNTPYEAYRGIYASVPRAPHPPWGCDTTPYGNSGSYSCRQTPMDQPTSQYYNPLETDSYLPSYDTDILNRRYLFASPLYQTVWSPPASLRNSSSHTPVFGSMRECDLEEGVYNVRHVYPPNEECTSPQVSGGAFNSIREADQEECNQDQPRRHVYAPPCESSSSPKTDSIENSPDGIRSSKEQIDGVDIDTGPGNEIDPGAQDDAES